MLRLRKLWCFISMFFVFFRVECLKVEGILVILWLVSVGNVVVCVVVVLVGDKVVVVVVMLDCEVC